MREEDWVDSVVISACEGLRLKEPSLIISSRTKLPYAFEIRTYKENKPALNSTSPYKTDLLIAEEVEPTVWKPRIVIEAKISKVSTHDAITYSEKALMHKRVHPYLRYGILIGNRKQYPLPGRLFRHGANFDFMLSWVALKPSRSELSMLLNVLHDEIKASRDLEDILYTSRSRKRNKYTLLHRSLRLK